MKEVKPIEPWTLEDIESIISSWGAPICSLSSQLTQLHELDNEL